jgi:hypothetical protein
MCLGTYTVFVWKRGKGHVSFLWGVTVRTDMESDCSAAFIVGVRHDGGDVESPLACHDVECVSDVIGVKRPHGWWWGP